MDLESITYIAVFASGAIGGTGKFLQSKQEAKFRTVAGTVLLGSISGVVVISGALALIRFVVPQWNVNIEDWRFICCGLSTGFGFVQPKLAPLVELLFAGIARAFGFELKASK